MPTPDEYLNFAEELMAEGRDEDARDMLAAYDAAMAEAALTRPMTRATRVATPFEPQEDIAAAREEMIQEGAEATVATFGAALGDRGVYEAEQEEAAKLRAEAERERRRVVMAGREDPVELEGAIFRGSRIQDTPGYLLPGQTVEGQGVLADTPENRRLLEAREREAMTPRAETPVGVFEQTPDFFPQVTGRRFIDPDTGLATVPTVAQERREAFALQTERSEASMRAEEAELARQQKELDRRIAEEPESVGWYEKYVGTPGMAVAEVFTDPVEGTGVVETPLMATLRSTLGMVSVLGAEGYFRGLGYEVDEFGAPIDPDDFGYWLATQRRKGGMLAGKAGRALGLDESAEYIEAMADAGVSYPSAVVKGMVQPLKDLGVNDEYVNYFTDMIESVVPATFPLPGVATESTTRKTTTFDPEGRRRVEDMEFPDFLDDPMGFMEAERRRIWSNLAKGRTWGDEYLDSPATRDYYARVTGDPDDAYIAGMLPELLIPAGPELLGGPIGYGIGVAADAARITKGITRAKALAKAKKAVDAAQEAVQTARGTQRGTTAMRDAQSALETALARYNNLVETPGKYDAGVIKRIAEQGVRRIGLSDADVAKAVDALKVGAKEGDIALVDIRRRLAPVIGKEAALRVTALAKKNIPGDYVMLTDVIAVPRAALAEAKKNLNTVRRRLFTYRADEMMSNLFDLARRLPDGPVKQAVLQTRLDAIRGGAKEADGVYGYGYSAFKPEFQKKLRQVVKAAGRELGEPVDFVRRFDQRPPNRILEMNEGMSEALAKYDSWDDVPAQLRREAVNAYDYEYPHHFAKGARRTQDLTRAQMWFETAEQGMGLGKKILSSRIAGNTALGRRLRQRFGSLETETFAMARAAKELRAKGSTAIRSLRDAFMKEVKQAGNVDDALDSLLRRSFAFDSAAEVGAPPLEVYDKIFGHLYGEFNKGRVLEAAQQVDLLKKETKIVRLEDGTDDLVTEIAYPTMANLRAIDGFFSSEKGGDLLPGLSILAPDFQAAILKTVLEDSIRPLLSKQTKDIMQAGAAPRSVEIRSETGMINLEQAFSRAGESAENFSERSRLLLPFPEKGQTVTLPPRMDTTFGQRMMTYDTTASFAEAALARGGDELFAMLDQVPVRARGDFLKMAGDYMLDKGPRRVRDVVNRLQYGYIVPNVMGQATELLKQAITPIVTMGARNAIDATDRMFNRVLQRRINGGGILSDGVYYSPKMLEDLAESYGVGRTGLEQARTGSLAEDLRREARNLAKSKGGKAADAVGEVLDPRQRGYFLRLAEGLELNFRKSVFEMALARGDAPTEAADLARRSQLDFTEIPDLVNNWLTPVFAQSASLYALGSETVGALVRNPRRATQVLKGMRMKAEAQDPYNVYGDKALKSLGMIGVTDNEFGKGKLTFFPPKGEVYYLPELPIFAAPEALLFGARNADLFIDDVRFAYGLRGEAGVVEALGDATIGTAKQTVETILPSILDAYDRFSEGEAYQTQGVPEAAVMSDEKAFWALALKARENDPNGDPGGEWTTFLNKYQPIHVKPPAGMGAEGNPLAWKQQPPEGIPHVLYDINDKGERLYYVFKPSDEGLKQIRTWRLLRPEVIEQATVFYSMMGEQDRREAPPRAIFPQPVLPETAAGAITEAIVPKVSMPVQEARRQQAELVRAIRSGE